MSSSQEAIRTAKKIVSDASRGGFDLCLWLGRVVPPKGAKLSPAFAEQIQKHEDIIRFIILNRLRVERESSKEDHKWVLRLGDKPGARILRPALIACGTKTWCNRMLHQASMFETASDRSRWLILERDSVGSVFVDDHERLVAALLKLPNGVELGGPKGSRARVLSACHECRNSLVRPDGETSE
jgi:hypothetical protein